jgi:SAM-dependent methyltransferase
MDTGLAITRHNTQPITDWPDMPHGEWVCDQLNLMLHPWWPRLFGYHLLKLGELSHRIDCGGSPIRHHVQLGKWSKITDLLADPEHLPIATNSVDVCLLALTLNQSQDPYQLMREAHRVLIPDGHIVLAAVNPLSLLGGAGILPSRRRQFPWAGSHFSHFRVTDWLKLLGCEPIWHDYFCYGSLIGKRPERQWFARLMRRYLKGSGSFYVIIAKKREIPLTPVKERIIIPRKLRTAPLATREPVDV